MTEPAAPRKKPTRKQLDAQALRDRGLSYRQIGLLLGVSGNSVRMRLVVLHRNQ